MPLEVLPVEAWAMPPAACQTPSEELAEAAPARVPASLKNFAALKIQGAATIRTRAEISRIKPLCPSSKLAKTWIFSCGYPKPIHPALLDRVCLITPARQWVPI
jgi:hypothetical protein